MLWDCEKACAGGMPSGRTGARNWIRRRRPSQYNQNLDTSPRHCEKIISTGTYQDRLDTLNVVREAWMSGHCGGIVGMGEEPEDRAGLLHLLATPAAHPESVPINRPEQAAAGTPLAAAPA